MKRVAVLMTVHNRREKTLKCLGCLYDNTIPEGYSVELYLTDDGCTDGTPESVKEQYPDVHIIQGDGNLYWNRGMWTAWDEAAKEDYDYYLWLNDDTYLYPNALLSILTVSAREKDKAIIVGATENAGKTVITYGGYINNQIQIPHGEPIEVEHFNGNIVLIPRKVFLELGNLDYYFRHSKGDFDYGIRAKKVGIRIELVGDTVAECEHHSRLSAWCDPKVSFTKRWKAMWSPIGMSPVEFFYFDKKHKGYNPAITHFFTIIIRCIFPSLWLNFKS